MRKHWIPIHGVCWIEGSPKFNKRRPVLRLSPLDIDSSAANTEPVSLQIPLTIELVTVSPTSASRMLPSKAQGQASSKEGQM